MCRPHNTQLAGSKSLRPKPLLCAGYSSYMRLAGRRAALPNVSTPRASRALAQHGSEPIRASMRSGKWVGSAIHGDPKRGYGILNNERYIGRHNWGRLQWKRGAANSKIRTAIVADPASLVMREEQRLRIIFDELWQRVKARQFAQSIGPHGTKASKPGKPATSLLSGLLLCEECGSRFIASNQYGYQCATRTYGGVSACSN